MILNLILLLPFVVATRFVGLRNPNARFGTDFTRARILHRYHFLLEATPFLHAWLERHLFHAIVDTELGLLCLALERIDSQTVLGVLVGRCVWNEVLFIFFVHALALNLLGFVQTVGVFALLR